MIHIQELCKFLVIAKKSTFASGEETIKFNSEEIYKAKYIGGLVDQRKE